MRCLLSSVNHESWFCTAAIVLTELVRWVGLPPKVRPVIALDPSSNVELTRTPALGITRYGVVADRCWLMPTDVSLRMPVSKYIVCLPCTAPNQLLVRRSFVGNAVICANGAFSRTKLLAAVIVTACPVVDVGGAQSKF